MKKYLFFALAAVGLLASCNKNKVEVGGELEILGDGSPVAIQIGARTASVDVKTKAYAMDSWEGTEDVTVFAIPTGEGDNILIPAKPTEPGGAQGSAVALTTYGTGEGATTETYYYAPDVVYNFYGMYVGDADVTEEIAATTTSYNITIDGTQDVMLATTDKVKDFDASTDPKKGVYEMLSPYIYGEQAARRGVNPTLTFEHMLTGFVIDVESGDGQESFITSLAITAHTSGTLDVVGKTLTATGDASDLQLLAVAENAEAPTSETTTDFLAKEVLLIDADSYELKIKLQGSDSEKIVSLTPDRITDKTVARDFLPGTKYSITIKVYGNEEIEIFAEILPWETEVLDAEDTGSYQHNFTLLDGSVMNVTVSFTGGITVNSITSASNETVTIEPKDYYSQAGTIITVALVGDVASATVKSAPSIEAYVVTGGTVATETTKVYLFNPENPENPTPDEGQYGWPAGEYQVGTYSEDVFNRDYGFTVGATGVISNVQ